MVCQSTENESLLDSRKFYQWSHCGIFHSTQMADDALIDAMGRIDKGIGKNPDFDGWLIDPWKSLNQIENYIDHCINRIQKENLVEKSNF